MGEVCINGRFVYEIKHKPLKAGHAKTDAYVDNVRRIDARFRAKGPQDALGGEWFFPNIRVAKFKSLASSRSIQKMELQGHGWPNSILKAKPLGMQIYVLPPLFTVNNPETMWKLIKHLYGLATAQR